MAEDPRGPLLRRLVAYEIPIEPVLEALANLPYDCERDLVQLTPRDIVAIIDRCARGELSIEQATDWADLLESRDGIGFAPPHSERTSEALFRIGNPTLQGEVTPQVLSALRAELDSLAG
jgi:hypothetical protein